MVTPVCGFFFSRQILSAQPVGSTHTVELADTHRDPEAFSHEVLDLAAGGRRVALAVIQHQGEHFPAQFDRVTMSPLDQSVLAFTLDSAATADMQWYDASEWSSAFSPLWPPPQASLVEQAQASLIFVLDVDLTLLQATSPSLLLFPSFLSFLLQKPATCLACVFLDESQFRLMSTNRPSRCFPVRSYSWASICCLFASRLCFSLSACLLKTRGFSTG
jgi:hypothetical protein